MKPSRVILAILLASCANPEQPAAAHVNFRMESLLCGPSQKFALTFFIDQIAVGTDSLHDGQISAIFTTSPGSHHLSATIPRVISTGDTTVVVKADSTFTGRVNVYCS
jgi:hypothetical protein